MKQVLFLQELHLSREETSSQLRKAAGDKYEAIWFDSPHLQELSGSVEILVTCEHQVQESLLVKWPRLRMISLGFTGYDRVDLAYTRSKGIAVYYVPGYATLSVAELNVGLTLSLLRKLPAADHTIREGKWDREVSPGIELTGKTVGIIGTGTIGLATARLFQAFGCEIIGWSRTRREEFRQIGGVYVDESDLFSRSDIVIVCLALNEHTRYFVNDPRLARMKNGAVLINSARSELVSRAALLSVLRQGKISAGIDAFDDKTEKGGMDELFKLKNVVLTPHLGFKTRESLARLAETTLKNIGRFLVGSEENAIR